MPVSQLSTTKRIDLVTFDLYDTLVEMDATRWHRFGRAMQAVGFAADDDLLRTIDRAAEDYYTIENGRSPIRERSSEGKAEFWLEYTRIYLGAAGAPADPGSVDRVRQHFVDEIGTSGWTYSMFDDVMSAVQRLEASGVKRAVISNADADVTAFCLRMGFAPHMDVIVTSALVGYEKPDQRTFFAALEPLGISPEHALHVGDQALSDVSGSLAIGMQAALLDRYGRHDDDEHTGAIVVQSLTELVDLVLEHNQTIG